MRRATPADAAGVARILNRVIADGRFSLLDSEFSNAAERVFIEELPPEGFMHVAETPDEAIVGFETVEPYAAFATHEMDHVATMGTMVDAACRRRGVGRRLFAATVRAARDLGYEKIVTDVRADNPGSLAFHAALGFTVVGTARRQARVRRIGRPPDGRPDDASSAFEYVDVVFIECFLDDVEDV